MKSNPEKPSRRWKERARRPRSCCAQPSIPGKSECPRPWICVFCYKQGQRSCPNLMPDRSLHPASTWEPSRHTVAWGVEERLGVLRDGRAWLCVKVKSDPITPRQTHAHTHWQLQALPRPSRGCVCLLLLPEALVIAYNSSSLKSVLEFTTIQRILCLFSGS